MDTTTGRVYEVSEGSTPTRSSVPLKEEEAAELVALSNNRARLRRYKQAHADDSCRSCQKPLSGHTLRQFQACYAG